MIYDRCPSCKAALYFHAITSVKGEWRRWMECPKCGLLTCANEYGMLAASTRQPPKHVLRGAE